MADEENKEFRHIVRIMNTDIKGTMRLKYGLTKIKGVGIMMANALCLTEGLDPHKKVGELTNEEIKALERFLSDPLSAGVPEWMVNRRKDPVTGKTSHLVSSNLRFTREQDVKRMIKMRSYRGLRHAYGLPVRGQRTRSNFRRNKGKVTGVKKAKGRK